MEQEQDYVIKKATLNDVDFIADVIIGAEKSLTDNLGWIMAVGNDLAYDQILPDAMALPRRLRASARSPATRRSVTRCEMAMNAASRKIVPARGATTPHSASAAFAE